ncbi:MAG: Ig-like domain-containing protein [Bacteroidales bacterium]|nr:Ig-like domain-containing protein [Bacteroidales bacterium]
MKKIPAICVSAIFFLTHCTNSENTEPSTPVPPRLLLSVPADNATDVPTDELIISLTFDRNVICPSERQTEITLPNATVSKIAYNSQKPDIFIHVNDLAYSTAYRLTIPEGVIKSAENADAPKITLNFTTAQPTENNAPPLVVRSPSPEAISLYAFLHENYGKKILSGTMANVSWNINEAEWVFKHTGKYPALNGFDYIHLYASPANWIDYGNTKVVEDWWNARGIVSCMWHWNVPTANGSNIYAFYTPGSGAPSTVFDIARAVQEGTDENSIIKADLNRIADYLLLLKQKNIPVLWRPLHEAAGGWFWWGAKGPTPCKALWKLMFDVFDAKGLNNLIWVWTAEPNDDAWYPGDEYVDIVGRDIYNKTAASVLFSEYSSLKARYPDKLITLSECGNVAGIPEQWNAGAIWSWFMTWYDYERTANTASPAFNQIDHAHATAAFWQKAFASDRVISRDKMPDLKASQLNSTERRILSPRASFGNISVNLENGGETDKN